MTIKEVEQYLEVPRATVRFYEKEGLIRPERSGNGYRDYSEEDVERLRKIIVFRKLGMGLNDIEDVLDGAKPLSEAVAENIVNLEKQIEELKGALFVCHKLQEEKEELETFEVEKYWNVIAEEEKKGNRFLDIAKDMMRYEKTVFLEWFDIADAEGNLAVSVPKAILAVFGMALGWGVVSCLFEGDWSRQSVLEGIKMFISVLIIELVIGIPIFFMGIKNPEILKKGNRDKMKLKILFGLTLFFALLVVASQVFGW